jgi:hypothetical protein
MELWKPAGFTCSPALPIAIAHRHCSPQPRVQATRSKERIGQPVRYPVARRRSLPAHFPKVRTGFKIGPLLLEFCLPRLPLRGLDRKGDRGAGGYRILRLAPERVFALRREGDRFATRAARNEYRTETCSVPFAGITSGFT